MFSEPWRHLNGTVKCYVKQYDKGLKGQTMCVSVMSRILIVCHRLRFYFVAFENRTRILGQGLILRVGQGGPRAREH